MSIVVSRRALVGAALLSACGRARADQSEMCGQRLLTGVNIAGLEFNGGRQPGRLDHDYCAPRPAEFAYFRACGARAVRLPFLWERLQPELGGPFDAAYAGLIDAAVEQARAHEMFLVLDAHQYGRRRAGGQSHIIGETSAVTARHFAQFWAEIAERYRQSPDIAFGLTNEPHDQDMANLVAVQNEAIAAIRETRARQLVLVSGNAWSGAHSWVRSGNAEAMLAIRDPEDNLGFDVHQYLDADSSGRTGACVPGAGGRRLNAFTQWARAHGKRGFLGEFGAGAGDECAAELASLLESLGENRTHWIGWTYWAGGAWWGANYPLSIEPISLERPVDRPQMAALRRYFE